MSLEQRKIELISWIVSLKNDAILKQLEDLQQSKEVVDEIPKEIMELLEISSNEPKTALTEYTTAREMLIK